MKNIYEYDLITIDNEKIPFDKFKNYVILIVNTASKCGFAKQYHELELLYEKYKNNNFLIIGFPCSQFLNQEFSSEDEIKKFCSTKYNVTFLLSKKIFVKGKNIDNLFNYLINNTKENDKVKNIKWNFEKFLITKNGNIYKRYMSKTKPFEIEKDIINLIK